MTTAAEKRTEQSIPAMEAEKRLKILNESLQKTLEKKKLKELLRTTKTQ